VEALVDVGDATAVTAIVRTMVDPPTVTVTGAMDVVVGLLAEEGGVVVAVVIVVEEAFEVATLLVVAPPAGPRSF